VLTFGVGLAVVAAEQARALPRRLRSVPPAAVRLTRSTLAAGRSRYDELAVRGRQVLNGENGRPSPAPFSAPPSGPAAGPAAGTVPPPGASSPLHLPPLAAAEVLARPPGALLDHDELPLEDYDHLTLPQLRSRLRRLDLAGLAQVRDYERAHGDRLPVLTLLENRIAALVEETVGGS
jgi:hypothetical protein